MADIDRLDQRLSAVERVVVDGDVALDELSGLTSLAEAVSDIETRLEEHERRLADLEAAVQSVEGYVGNVESITDDAERQAASAVATVDRLERRVETLEVEVDDLEGGLLEDESWSTGDGGDGTGDGGDGAGDGEGDPNGDANDAESSADAGGFEFGFAADPTPERSVRELVQGEEGARPIVDDGADRPTSSANQSAVDSAVGDGGSSATDCDTTGGDDIDDDAERGADEGLVDSLRARFS